MKSLKTIIESRYIIVIGLSSICNIIQRNINNFDYRNTIQQYINGADFESLVNAKLNDPNFEQTWFYFKLYMQTLKRICRHVSPSDFESFMGMIHTKTLDIPGDQKYYHLYMEAKRCEYYMIRQEPTYLIKVTGEEVTDIYHIILPTGFNDFEIFLMIVSFLGLVYVYVIPLVYCSILPGYSRPQYKQSYGSFVDIFIADRIKKENFHVLNPLLSHNYIFIFRYSRFFGCCFGTINNILDLFRGTHFRVCLTDPELLKTFDEIFTARFAGLDIKEAITICESGSGTLEQLYNSFPEKGFVTAEEIGKFANKLLKYNYADIIKCTDIYLLKDAMYKDAINSYNQAKAERDKNK